MKSKSYSQLIGRNHHRNSRMVIHRIDGLVPFRLTIFTPVSRYPTVLTGEALSGTSYR